MRYAPLLFAAALAMAQLGPQPGPLDEEIRKQLNAGKFRETEPAVRKMLLDAETQDGPESPAVGRALDFLLEIANRSGRKLDEQQLALAARAIALKEKLYGANSRQAARTIRLVAEMYIDGRQLRQA
jgi:hypothetical protein